MSHVKELGKKQTIPIIQRNCIRTQYLTQHLNVPFRRILSHLRILLCPTVVTNTTRLLWRAQLGYTLFSGRCCYPFVHVLFITLCVFSVCVCGHFHMCAHRRVCTTRRPEDILGIIPQALSIFVF